MNAIIRYPGSKWRIARQIIDIFPTHHSYVEPFFGSGAILFNKPRSNIETVNDLDDNVTNLFEWIQKDPEQLAHAIYYTPYARTVYESAFYSRPSDSLQKAVNFCICLNMGHGFRTTGKKDGWKNDVQGRERAYAASEWTKLPERIYQAAERLRGVQIENRPAVEIIQRFNSKKVLLYIDPPYMLDTRDGGKQYRYEMTDKEHAELLEIVREHKGDVIISGYDAELYNNMLKGWYREEISNYTQACSRKKEVLWMNFLPVRQIKMNL